jgi:hypothetical protein
MRRYYVYSFLSGLQFTWTTWLAFVVARGGNPGWAEAAYHMAILLGEVPTGVVADLMGRRTSMLVGLALGALGPLGYFFITDTLTACLVLAFSGLAGTFVSGADSALIYEKAAALGGAEYARKVMSRNMALMMAASALSPAIAGFLYQFNEYAPFLGKSVVTLLTLAVVWGMQEQRPAPDALAGAVGRVSPFRQAALAFRVLRSNPVAWILIVFGWVYNTGAAMTGQFAQAYFPFMGLTMGAAGIAFSVAQVASTGGAALGERLTGSAANRMLRYGPLFMALCYLAMGVAGGFGGGLAAALVGAGALVLAQGTDGVLYPSYQARFNEAIPDAQRATILSMQSMGFSLLMSVSFPAASYLPIPAIYLVTGVVSVVLAVIWMVRRWAY